MKDIYQEVIDEGNEILEKGIAHLRRSERIQTKVSPIADYTEWQTDIFEDDREIVLMPPKTLA